MTGRAARLLLFSIDPVVGDAVPSCGCGCGTGPGSRRGDGAPLVLMTQRIRLDAYLVERAIAAGAELRDGMKVTAVATEPDGAEVVAGGERLLAGTVIGADGVNGVRPGARARR